MMREMSEKVRKTKERCDKRKRHLENVIKRKKRWCWRYFRSNKRRPSEEEIMLYVLKEFL